MTKDVKGTKEPKEMYHFSAVDSIERLPLSEQVYNFETGYFNREAITARKTK